jgi:hypothetical protein
MGPWADEEEELLELETYKKLDAEARQALKRLLNRSPFLGTPTSKISRTPELADAQMREIRQPVDARINILKKRLAGKTRGEDGFSKDSLLTERSTQLTNRYSRRGPIADDDGHKRVAEILQMNNWANNLKDSLELLASPPDGGPSPRPSSAWQKKYKVESYGEVFDKIGNKEIEMHLDRRRKLGMTLLNES